MNTRHSYFSPETPATYHILAALAVRPLPAYAIMQQVNTDANGSIIMKMSSLSHALKRLLGRGLIELEDPEGSTPRRYRLRPGGRNVLELELKRLKHAVFIGEWSLAGRHVANLGTLEI